jgi:hypothetical protein
MLGFPDLPGALRPCDVCGSLSGDCGWLSREARCSSACETCGGRSAARCAYCLEVVPCCGEIGRNPRPDAACAWRALAALHAPHCPWTRTRGGETEPMPLVVRPLPR